MLAVYFTLKCFAKDFSNLTVIIHIENTTVISILKNMGTSHNKLLNKKCKLIWEWCKSKNIQLFPVYVNTKHNLADETSRKIYSQGEWMLARTIFSKASQSFLQVYQTKVLILSWHQGKNPPQLNN